MERGVFLAASEPVTLNTIVYTFDYSDIASFATVEQGSLGIPATCTLTGPAVLTCQSLLPLHLTAVTGFSPGIVIAAKASAALGEEGTLHITVAADGVTPASHDARVRTGTAVNLDAGAPTSGSVAFGQPFTDTQQVTNVGDNPVHGIGLFLFNDPAFRAATKFSNCTYVGDRPRTCRFDQVLSPGVTYEVAIRMSSAPTRSRRRYRRRSTRGRPRPTLRTMSSGSSTSAGTWANPGRAAPWNWSRSTRPRPRASRRTSHRSTTPTSCSSP